jgi:drug/metabolite transporter (DMT)-like permease
MSLLVFFVVLGSALGHATWNTLIKSGDDPLLNGAALCVAWIALAAVILPWLPVPLVASWPYLILSATIHIVYFCLLSNAYRFGELASCYTLMRGCPPLLVAVGASWWAHDWLPWKAWVGIVILFGGILVIGGRMLFSAQRKSLLFSLLAALTIASYTLLDGLGARRSGHALSYALWLGLFHAVPYVAGVAVWRGKSVWSGLLSRWKRGALSGAMSIGGYAVVLWAMTRAPIGLVSALRETSVVFAMLLGIWVFKEKLSFSKGIAMAMVVIGASIIKLSS